MMQKKNMGVYISMLLTQCPYAATKTIEDGGQSNGTSSVTSFKIMSFKWPKFNCKSFVNKLSEPYVI